MTFEEIIQLAHQLALIDYELEHKTISAKRRTYLVRARATAIAEGEKNFKYELTSFTFEYIQTYQNLKLITLRQIEKEILEQERIGNHEFQNE